MAELSNQVKNRANHLSSSQCGMKEKIEDLFRQQKEMDCFGDNRGVS